VRGLRTLFSALLGSPASLHPTAQTRHCSVETARRISRQAIAVPKRAVGAVGWSSWLHDGSLQCSGRRCSTWKACC